MARLSVAEGPCSALLTTVHGCHYAFQKFTFFCHPIHILYTINQMYTTTILTQKVTNLQLPTGCTHTLYKLREGSRQTKLQYPNNTTSTHDGQPCHTALQTIYIHPNSVSSTSATYLIETTVRYPLLLNDTVFTFYYILSWIYILCKLMGSH
jgi:hypothetical protein